MPDFIRQCQVTLALILGAGLAYLLFGAGALDTGGQSASARFLDSLMNVFRHGHSAHLFGNALILFWAGTLIEPRFGSKCVALLALGAILLGTGLQVLLVGNDFLGLSGVAYCFAICALVLNASLAGTAFILACAALMIGTEVLYMSDRIAVFVHMGGALTGGGWSMFNKIFGQKKDAPPAADPNQPFLAPLDSKQISRIVDIINETDDDDAEDANETLRARGCQGMYALWFQNRIIGVTGYAPSEANSDVVWLSWTYLEKDAQGKALGRFMMDELLRMLNTQKVRKIFISTSDYRDEEDGTDVYAEARKFYETLGATLELTLPAFYSEDESKLIYGLVNPGMEAAPPMDNLGGRGVEFTGISLDEDSEDIGAIEWEEKELGVSGIERILGLAHSRQFRQSLLALPEDISKSAASRLENKKFERIGVLKDYYDKGLDQVWWRIQLT